MSLNTSLCAPAEDIIHGVTVRDPYRWLEERSLPETEQWIKDQHRRCEEYFSSFGNLDALRSIVQKYLDVEVADQPAKVAGRYFYRMRKQREEQAKIYVRDVMTGEEKLLIDPAKEEPFASVGIHGISEDGSLLAYEVKHGGEHRKAVCIVDVKTGFIVPDRIENGYARGFTFLSDLRGFYYCHEKHDDSEDHTIRLHLFQAATTDQVIFRVSRSRGSRLVLISDRIHLGAIWVRSYLSEFVADFFIARRDKPADWKQVFAKRALPYTPFLKYGCLFALSYDGAPNGRLTELSNDGREIRTLIPERDAMIRQIVFTDKKIFASYLHHPILTIGSWDLSGVIQASVAVPQDGSIQLLPNHSDAGDSLFYSYESLIGPLQIFEYLPSVRESQLWHRRLLPYKVAPSNLRTVLYQSRDATQIPMMIMTPYKTCARTAKSLIMTSYGGFGVSMMPRFSVLVSIMMDLGVAFAVPNIRGGGEFGKQWHDAARGQKRQVAFDDFIAAAEWLCAKGETIPEKLAIFGGCNAGLLVGAAMTQRPDLFCAVLCIAPLLDMVRYESFDQAIKWQFEYGTVGDTKDFQALYAYSPYHRVEDGLDYPSILFVSGDKDDLCNPAHVRKMAARLQDRRAQKHPVLVDYSEQRGHSPVLPLSVRADALMRRIAFLCRELKIPLPVSGGIRETTRA
jgi:prolyl oligopeptidase